MVNVFKSKVVCVYVCVERVTYTRTMAQWNEM